MTRVSTESQLAFREMQQRNKIYIPKEIFKNWGDDFKTKRGILGIFGSTTKMDNGTSIEVWAKDFNALGLEMIDVDNGIQACADSMIQLLSKGNEVEIDILREKMEALDTILKDLRGEITSTSAAASTLNANDIMLSMPKSAMGEEITADATKATAALNTLDNAIDNVQAEMNVQLENPFEGLIVGLESLKNVNIPAEKFAGIQTLANSLSKFGGKNVGKAIASIPLVGRSFASMAREMASVPAISDNLVKLAQALAQFSKQANTASTSSNNFSKSTNFLHQALNRSLMSSRRTHRGFTSLASLFGRLYANFFLLIRAARALGNAMDYSSSMTEAANVVSVVFGKQANVMDEFAQTAIKDFGMARLSATEFASRFQAMGKTMGITAEQIGKANDFINSKISGNERAYKDLGDSVADMSINLTKLTADMASLYNQDYADVAADMQAIYTGMTRPLRKYGLDLTQATLKEWAMANGLEYDIEKMSQAEKTMLRYQYVMSRTAGAMGDFQKTADTWANAMRTVKQLLQEIARTIGEALINALRPALLAFRNFLFNFLQLTESALNALGKLLGWKQINFGGAALVEDMEDYADAIDDAAGAAKKLKGQLRGIDELNNLTTNDKGGSGSGLGGLLGAGDESLWDQIIDTEKDYESTVESFYDFGRRISEAIKNGLTSIDWDEVFKSVIGFGTNFAEFLNGLIDPETWKVFGKTLANGLKAAIKLAFAFGSEFDWENLGEAIAEGINGFFEEFDGGELANTIDVWVQGIGKVLKTAIGKIKWREIFEDLFDFFTNLDIETINIGVTAATTVLGISALTGLIASLVMANPVVIPSIGLAIGAGYLVGVTIGELLEDAFGVNDATGETNWYEFWESIFDTMHIDDAYNALSDRLSREKTGKDPKWAEYFGPNRPKQGREAGTNNRTLNSPSTGITRLWEQIFDEIGFTDFIKDNDIKSWAELGLVTWLGLDDYKTLKTFNEEWSKFWEQIGGIKGFAGIALMEEFGWLVDIDWNSILTALGAVLTTVVAIADPTNSAGISDVGEAFINLYESTGLADTGLGKLIEGFKTFREDTKKSLDEWLEKDVKPIFDLERWLELVSTIKTSLKQTWENARLEVANILTTWFNSLKEGKFSLEHLNEIFGNIKLALGSAFKAGADIAVEALNKIISGIESLINNSMDGFNSIIELANRLSDSINIKTWNKITLPKIATPFASGGFPQVGSLFLAGEAGSEFVGNINGRTGVVSNGEITGIASAIRQSSDAEIQLLRQQNVLLQGILEKEFGITSDYVFRSVRTSAGEYTRRTGNPAFS